MGQLRQPPMAPAPHPIFPTDQTKTAGQHEQQALPHRSTNLSEMLRTLRGRSLDQHDLTTAELIGLAINELEERLAVIDSQRQQISRQKRIISSAAKSAARRSSPLLPGELPRTAPPLAMRDNPPPNCFDPLELVVSEQTAMRALVRHYHWTHDGPDCLLRCRVLTPDELTPPAAAAAADAVVQLEEPTGSISDLAAAAANEVA